MPYGDFKDIARATGSDEVLRDKAFNIAENPKYDGYKRFCFHSLYIKIFDKKSASLVDKSATFGSIKNETKQNEQELLKKKNKN